MTDHPIQPHEAQAELDRREAARKSMLAFTMYTKPDYQADKFHETLCHYLDEWIEGRIKRLMICAPPQHGKSEISSRRGPALVLGRNPDARVIGCSYASNLAAEMNRDVQRIIESDRFAALFPNIRLPQLGGEAGYVRNAGKFEIIGRLGSYRAAGRGQGITGMKATHIFLDDLIKNQDEAASPTIREAAWRWYTSSVYTRLAENGSILFVTTRWDRDDVAGRMQKQDGGQWVVLNFPATAPLTPPPYDRRVHGEALCPRLFSVAALADKKNTLGASQYGAMYEQNPRPPGATEFDDDCFGDDIWFERWPSNMILRTLALDPSKGKSDKKGDFSAAVLLGLHKDGTLYCEADLERRGISQMVSDVVEIHRINKPDAFGVESNQFQELLATDFDEEFRQRGMLAPSPWLIDNRVNKRVRIRRLGGYLSSGRIKFKSQSRGTELLVEQLKDFPNGDHDDGPDALEMAVRLMGALVDGAGDDQPPEDTYEQVYA